MIDKRRYIPGTVHPEFVMREFEAFVKERGFNYHGGRTHAIRELIYQARKDASPEFARQYEFVTRELRPKVKKTKRTKRK